MNAITATKTYEKINNRWHTTDLCLSLVALVAWHHHETQTFLAEHCEQIQHLQRKTMHKTFNISMPTMKWPTIHHMY